MEHSRHSIRLQTHDYRNGSYHVILGIYKHVCVLGNVVEGKFVENELGRIVLKWHGELSSRFTNVKMRVIQLMPNHVHTILILKPECVGRGNRAPTLGQVMAYWKYNATKEINSRGGVAPPLYERNWAYLFEGKLFQKNYYERVIRNNEEMERTEKYILDNPRNWEQDKENPKNICRGGVATLKIS